jgi:hypothetical protein
MASIRHPDGLVVSMLARYPSLALVLYGNINRIEGLEDVVVLDVGASRPPTKKRGCC